MNTPNASGRPRLGIGTVQFGTEYGITNRRGKPSMTEVSRIVQLAADAGATLLDTAALYGEAEQVLGSVLPLRHGFDIVTKTIQLRKAEIMRSDVDRVEQAFHVSLLRLRQTSVYGLLAHHADDLLAPGGDQLFARMQEWKRARQVKKIGVSVYSAAQIDALLPRYPIDIIQLPLNLLDQRLVISGHLARLRKRNVEIHSRSVFLQGLLLIPPDRLPDYFHPVRGLLKTYNTWLNRQGWSPLEGALAYVRTRPEIDTVIVGVCVREELQEIFEAWSHLTDKPIDMSAFQCDNDDVVNPSTWKVKT
ncbi:MAG: aldo/keto reductase [candidate division Zixibacteria bacterium]|nr:aldo/keto reductase [candidate division Zixibacteria bacterium]